VTVKVERVGKQTVVPLETPIRVAADMVEELTFRAVRAGDFRIMDSNKGMADMTLQLIEKLSVPEMIKGQADNLSAEDFIRVSEIVNGFFNGLQKSISEPATS
jgi:hypothetical protein